MMRSDSFEIQKNTLVKKQKEGFYQDSLKFLSTTKVLPSEQVGCSPLEVFKNHVSALYFSQSCNSQGFLFQRSPSQLDDHHKMLK